MELIFQLILELIVGLFAILIYGTVDRPKHPFWRNTLRGFAFAGALVLAVRLIFPSSNISTPSFLNALWGLSFLTVLLAEYDFGNRKLAVVSWISAAALLGLGLWSEGVF